MSAITVERSIDKNRLAELKVETWPVWAKEPSEFTWRYHEDEVCYFIEGDALITLENGESMRVAKGDLVTFPKGLTCKWTIEKGIRKHYCFT